MLSQIDVTATLQSIPWFRELKPYQLDQLAGIIEIRRLSKDEALFVEGEKIDNLYVVIEGRVSIDNYVPGKGNVRVFTAEPLDIIGWASLTPVIRQREDTARAILPSTLLSFKGELLRQMCDQDHDLGYFIMRRLANVVASRLLSTKFQLLDIIACLQTDHRNSPSSSSIPE